MSVSKSALIAMLGFVPMIALTSPAISGNNVDIKTPGAAIDIFGGNKHIQAGDAKIKIKPGERGDCARIKAGNAKVAKGKIKNGKCRN